MTVRVFTNGCFDLLHPGHIDLLNRARSLGDQLIVGINSDDSVRKIKGNDRPVMSAEDRKAVLLGLRSVDEVHIFDELTPERLIKNVNPNILIKGGDWAINEIVGADHVRSTGGQVISLPLLGSFSSSEYFEKMRETPFVSDSSGVHPDKTDSLNEHRAVFDDLAANYRDSIAECGQILCDTFARGGKVLVCGNGGSAADAQHIAAEFVGRYEIERIALPSIALTTDTSALTALANDYSFERIFARQVEALGRPGDCLIAISTSGNSPNVIAAAMTARSIGATVIGLTGANGKKLASLTDACIMVPSERTARIQEGHITIAHIWCEMVDASIAAAK